MLHYVSTRPVDFFFFWKGRMYVFTQVHGTKNLNNFGIRRVVKQDQ